MRIVLLSAAAIALAACVVPRATGDEDTNVTPTTDAGHDAGSHSDAGPATDAGPHPDAGSPTDAGPPPDDGGCSPDCSGLQCGDDGCGGSCGSCGNAPASQCINSTTVRTFDMPTCGAGECQQAHTDTTCSGGCENGMCQNCTPDCTNLLCGGNGCGGSCGTCDTPPIPTCNGSELTTYSGTGTCTTGMCSYSDSVTTCANGCANGACNPSCMPDCTGKMCGDNGCGGSCGTCDSPPATKCQSTSILETYESAGTCESGGCAYTATDTTCTYGCANAKCNSMPVDAGPPASCTDGESSGPRVNVTCPSGQVCDSSNLCKPPQYVNNGDGTVTDNLTGLVWQQTAKAGLCWSASDAAGSAQEYCLNGSGLPGTGWRAPMLQELYSLVDVATSPTIDTTYFPTSASAYFWASDAYTSPVQPTTLNGGWAIQFSDGSVTWDYSCSSGMGAVNSVRCVR